MSAVIGEIFKSGYDLKISLNSKTSLYGAQLNWQHEIQMFSQTFCLLFCFAFKALKEKNVLNGGQGWIFSS